MVYLKVLNVGQGDSIVIRPQNGCKYSGDVFYVDVGSGHMDVTKEIRESDRVHIILTHHHSDHISGFKFFFNNFNQIVDITVPYCFNEMALIAKAILNLNGIKSAPNCSELIKLLNGITDDQLYLKTILTKSDSIRINFAYDGYSLCDHMKFLNPHMDEELIRELDEISEDNILELAFSLFEEDFANKLTRYIVAGKRGYGVDHPFYSSFIYNRNFNQEENDRDQEIRQSKAGCAIIVGFIKENYKLLQDFNSSPSKYRLQKIYDNYTRNAHDVCLVMKAGFVLDHSILLTGDASKKVFYRLIEKNEDLCSYYLKVPHHGSKNNLDKKILRAIDPYVAIISHDNGLFGRAIDPHPNKSVIDLLTNSGVNVAVTNDVIKHRSVYFSKTPFNDGYLEVD